MLLEQEQDILTYRYRAPMHSHSWSAVVFIVLGVAALILMLGGCASAPVAPTQQIQAAELAISNAEQARVADYSSVELSTAREKLVAARLAVEKKEMVKALRLAEQSKVEADLATAKAATAKEKAVNEELQKGNSTLKQEMERNTGVQP